jgi:hypothetical protein
VIFALASPTLADAASREKARTQHRAPQAQVQQAPPAPASTFYGPFGPQTPDGRAHFGDPAHQVYRVDGKYAGADPDPHIRMMLYFDDPNKDP